MAYYTLLEQICNKNTYQVYIFYVSCFQSNHSSNLVPRLWRRSNIDLSRERACPANRLEIVVGILHLLDLHFPLPFHYSSSRSNIIHSIILFSLPTLFCPLRLFHLRYFSP